MPDPLKRVFKHTSPLSRESSIGKVTPQYAVIGILTPSNLRL